VNSALRRVCCFTFGRWIKRAFRDVTSAVVSEVNNEGYYNRQQEQQQQDGSQVPAPVMTKGKKVVTFRCDVSGQLTASFVQTGCALYLLVQGDQCGCKGKKQSSGFRRINLYTIQCLRSKYGD